MRYRSSEVSVIDAVDDGGVFAEVAADLAHTAVHNGVDLRSIVHTSFYICCTVAGRNYTAAAADLDRHASVVDAILDVVAAFGILIGLGCKAHDTTIHHTTCAIGQVGPAVDIDLQGNFAVLDKGFEGATFGSIEFTEDGSGNAADCKALTHGRSGGSKLAVDLHVFDG